MPVYERKRKVETGVQLEHTFKTYLEHVGQNIFRARPKITDYPAVTRSQIEQFLSNVNVFFFKYFDSNYKPVFQKKENKLKIISSQQNV